tara:strand:- start:380 stop:1267 length:888 start_codon:yes stop_codon:yes gene_type:complete
MHSIKNQSGRLDRVLSDLSAHLSRSDIQRFIKQGFVQVNGIVIHKSGFMVESEDSITWSYDDEAKVSNSVDPVEMPLDIEYEDADICVVYKPRGMLVHGSGLSQEITLVSGLLFHCSELALSDDPHRPGVVHRLDRFTEGLIIVAKTARAFDGLKKQFHDRQVIKKYVAMVKGDVIEHDGMFKTMMGRHRVHRHKYTSFSPMEGTQKEAVTQYKVLKRFNTKTCVDIRLETGRTHQIRVHFSEAGHPLIGDTVYDSQCGKNYDGQHLQCYGLGFNHPVTQESCYFERPFSSIISI